MAAEGAGERDTLRRDAGALDEQLSAGIERGLRELDREDLALGVECVDGALAPVAR